MDAIIKYFADNFTSSPIAFSISLIVLAMSVVIYQLKSMKAIVIGQCVINFFVLLTYIFGDGLSGAAVSVVAIVHTFLIYWLFQRKGRSIPLWFVLMFAAIYIVCAAFTVTGITDILPIGAALSFAFSIVQAESWRYRLIVLANPLFWIAYDIVIAAPIPMLVTHVIAATAVIVGIIRLDIKKLISKDKNKI